MKTSYTTIGQVLLLVINIANASIVERGTFLLNHLSLLYSHANSMISGLRQWDVHYRDWTIVRSLLRSECGRL